MSRSINAVRLPLISSYCAVFPDTCIIVNYVFKEELFNQKVQFIVEMAKKGIPCEVLPHVRAEITKKLMETTSNYINNLKACTRQCESLCSLSSDKIMVTRNLAYLLEKAFSLLFKDASWKACTQNMGHYIGKAAQNIKIIEKERTRIRVVENAVMLAFWTEVNHGVSTNLREFMDKLEKSLEETYIAFCDLQSSFMQVTNAVLLTEGDLEETAKGLEQILQGCNVHNKQDVEMLRQAIGRMYRLNKWCSIVTTDYSDMVNNRELIDKTTMLRVSDPLYFVYHLDRKLDFSLNPKTGAPKLGVKVDTLVKCPPNIGVV